MIKLKDLLGEISLASGDASDASMESLYDRISYKILPKKYSDVSNWIGEEPRDEWSDQWKKRYEKAKQLSLVDSAFIGIINSKLPLVSSKGGYELRLMKSSNSLYFYLVDPNAKYIYEYFIGTITAQVGTNTFRFTPSKAFGLSTYQIHWSNVAREHKGKGLGKLMYTMVYEYVSGIGAALVSDGTLYQGSQKMWIDYIPSIASYFGIVLDDVFFPIDKSEVKANGRSLMGDSSVSAMVAMQNPPALIRKIANNVKGLSFSKGEYGVIHTSRGINDKLLDPSTSSYLRTNPDFTYFSNLVDESNSIMNLFIKFEKYGGPNIYDVTSYTSKSNLEAVVFGFSNVNVIIKKSGGKLVMVAI
jgi:GNAT superfamily N-acetyltransferase